VEDAAGRKWQIRRHKEGRERAGAGGPGQAGPGRAVACRPPRGPSRSAALRGA